MRFTPRGEEWKSALAVMEADGYKDGAAMAKDVVKAVHGDLVMRESYILVVREAAGHVPLFYGPFASEGDAQKLAAAVGLPWAVVPMTGAGVLEANIDGRDFGGFGYCKTKGCGHAPWMHHMEGSARGRCSESDCSCTKHKK